MPQTRGTKVALAECLTWMRESLGGHMLRHINPHLSKLKVSRCHCFCAGPFGCPPTTLVLLEHRSPGSGVFQCLIFSGAPCSRHWRWASSRRTLLMQVHRIRACKQEWPRRGCASFVKLRIWRKLQLRYRLALSENPSTAQGQGSSLAFTRIRLA